MIAYLDTNALVWLAAGEMSRFSARPASLIRNAELLFSPMVLLELEYLFEVNRGHISAQGFRQKVEHEAGVRLCNLPWPEVAEVALGEKWTRDPFDRMIVAHAKANGFAWLISADEKIAKHYPRTIW